MRAREFLTEVALSKAELRKHDGKYLNNLLDLIRSGAEIEIAPEARQYLGRFVTIDPDSIDHFMQMLDKPLVKNPYFAIKGTDGQEVVHLNRIQKNAAVKGKSADYNIGDIGEIALGVAGAARFLNRGDNVTEQEFLAVCKKLDVETFKGKSSLKLSYRDTITYKSGKNDEFSLIVLGPARSVDAFLRFTNDDTPLPKDVKGAILSSLKYINSSGKITSGVERTAADKNTNMISIVSDGVSDQKGTKADLIMFIDKARINLLSAKAGPSQLGQASGHDWNKPFTFFKTVFGTDISKLQKMWGTTNESHLATLQKVYKDYVIPKVLKLTGGDSVQKEKELIRSIANGLIRYSNNVDPETGEVETIDIVKLITNPGSPGYALMRIDDRLTAALEKTDLIGKATPNQQGVSVHGIVNGKSVLLFKARSYFSPEAKTVRTIIEGGPLLDTLAAVPDEVSAPTVQPQQLAQVPAFTGTARTAKKSLPKKDVEQEEEPINDE